MQKLFYLLLLGLIVFVIFSDAQDRCLEITRLPKPERPLIKPSLADEAGVGLRIEFRGDGKLGSIMPFASSLDKTIDKLVFDAAKGIEFKPKRIRGNSETVEREVNYTYSFKTLDWKISPDVGTCLTQSSLLTDAEENLLKSTAKQFISELMEIRNFRLLASRWFVPNFEPYSSPEIDFISEKLFFKLTVNERRKVFFDLWNYIYVQMLLEHSKPEEYRCYNQSIECEEKDRQSYLRIFPPETVEIIEDIERAGAPGTKSVNVKTKPDLFSEISKMKTFFDQAIPVLKAKNLERSSEFRETFELYENSYSLNYLIKEERAEKTLKNINGRILIKRGKSVFGVETPLLIRVDFVKLNGHFKVFNLGVGDGD